MNDAKDCPKIDRLNQKHGPWPVEELSRLFELSIDLLCAARMDGYFTMVNPAFERVLGYSTETMLSRPIVSFIHPDDVAKTQQELISLARGTDSIHFENRYIARDGSLVYLNWTGYPDVERGLVYAAAKNVTAIHQARQALQQVDERLRSSHQDMETVATVASHDLQEPLRKVQMFGRLLQDRYGKQLDAEGQDYLKRMVSATDRMQRMMNDLLRYAQLEHPVGQGFRPVDLDLVMREVLCNLEERIRQTKAQVSVGPLGWLQAEESQMYQLFQNLVGNALKFHRTNHPPQVQVVAESFSHQDRPWLRICVIDNGVGFSSDQAARIFQVFERLHPVGLYEGTGIGLAICHKIVSRHHHGRLYAESTPGEGSRFVVEIPVQQPMPVLVDALTLNEA